MIVRQSVFILLKGYRNWWALKFASPASYLVNVQLSLPYTGGQLVWCLVDELTATDTLPRILPKSYSASMSRAADSNNLLCVTGAYYAYRSIHRRCLCRWEVYSFVGMNYTASAMDKNNECCELAIDCLYVCHATTLSCFA